MDTICDLKIYCVLFDYCLFSLPAFGVFMKLFCDYFACDAFSGVFMRLFWDYFARDTFFGVFIRLLLVYVACNASFDVLSKRLNN